VLAVAPFALVAFANRWLADRMAVDMAASIDRFAAALPDEQEEQEHIVTKNTPPPKVVPVTVKAKTEQKPKDKPRGIGVLVTRKKLRALIAGGARPSGRPVAATSFRPAGLSLVGVSGFGVGMRDGDVLTSVGGAPASSYGSVASAVAGALRAGAPSISGEAWRGEQRIFITVELPEFQRDKKQTAEQPRAARPSVANKPNG